MSSTTALWLTVVALGLYHGLNPAMGWPLAVASGLTERRVGALLATMLPLGGGHFAAMAIVLAPFALMGWVFEWSRSIRLAAGMAVLLFGLYRLARPRHPRLLSRIAPSRLALWSFLMASAHGAGLMLLPFMLGLCQAAPDDAPAAAVAAAAGHAAVTDYLARSGLGTALLVGVVHSLAGLFAGAIMALLVYRCLGLKFLRSAWLDLDRAWGASLAVAGAAGMLLAA